MTNNIYYKILATLSTLGLFIIAVLLFTLIPQNPVKRHLPTDAIKTQRSSKKLHSQEPAWLIIQYKTRIGELLLDIPMQSLDQCWSQGSLWINANEESNNPLKTSFSCLKGR